jgi:prepilin-type N-terminal cleavage/methylation domain-containing protein
VELGLGVNTRLVYLGLMREKAFTLLELIIVIIVIGILATVAVSQFGGARELQMDREAQANLRLIVSAELIWRMESPGNTFYPTPAGIDNVLATINTNLRLALPAANWAYQVNSTVAGRICAQATRINVRAGLVRNWRMRNTENNPIVGVCP